MGLLTPWRNDDGDEYTFRTTPWVWRDVEGAYVGWNGEVWLYRELPVYPLTWEDPATRLERGAALHQLLVELAATGRDIAGIQQLSRKRDIHMVSVGWDDVPRIPEGIPAGQQNYLGATWTFKTPQRALLVGVRLFSSALGAFAKKKNRGASWMEALRQITDQTLGEGVPDMAAYEEDRHVMEEIFRRVGATVPSQVALRQLESWYNEGKGPDCELLEGREDIRRRVASTNTIIEMAAVMSFDRPHLTSPSDQWILEALTHPHPATVVSVRAFMEPAKNARERVRRNQRRLLSQQTEVGSTGDLGRVEDQITFDLTQQAEDYFATSGEPLVSGTSIVMARVSDDHPDQTYMDYLSTVFDIEMKPLEHRQMAALEETLPCSRARVNPFLQEVSVGMLSYAGLHAASRLGDPKGTIFMGLCDPGGAPVMIDPLGAPKANLPPAMFVLGDPGSGKASSVDAKVLTPSGWVRMGDIAVGDTVTGSDGAPQSVLGVFPQGEQDLFRVAFSDGAATEVTGDHLWTVTSPGTAPAQLSTAELSAALRAGAELRIPLLSAPAEFDWEKAAGSPLGDPFEYTHPSVRAAAVLSVLAGRDHAAPGSAESARTLAAAIRGLGGTARLDADTGRVSDVRLPSHLGAELPAPERILVSVQPAGRGHAQCIKVSNPDRLYVTDDYICTHNTFAMQMLATQSTLLGMQTIFINPKGFDTLSPFAEAVGGSVVKMSALEGQQGFFDPFRFAPTPAMAAEIAKDYILAVVGNGMTQSQRSMLGAVLKRAAAAGARCVGEALGQIPDESIKETILNTMAGTAAFSLGIGMAPQEPMGVQGGLTLIEFDRKLDLPEKGQDPGHYRDSQRISLAAVQLVFRASMEMLNRSGGGVLILDEAWTVLGTAEGLALLQQLAREGRSMNILPIFATQRVADLLREGVDMQSYMTRVLAMKLDEDKEAAAALTLCGLEPTPERIAWLHDCGPKRYEDGSSRPASGLHRDLEKRCSALMVGPVPADFYTAFTTNPEEKKARDRRGE